MSHLTKSRDFYTFDAIITTTITTLQKQHIEINFRKSSYN